HAAGQDKTGAAEVALHKALCTRIETPAFGQVEMRRRGEPLRIVRIEPESVGLVPPAQHAFPCATDRFGQKVEWPFGGRRDRKCAFGTKQAERRGLVILISGGQRCNFVQTRKIKRAALTLFIVQSVVIGEVASEIVANNCEGA